MELPNVLKYVLFACLFVNHREKIDYVLPKLGKMLISMCVCMYVCMYLWVLSIIATPFNMQLRNVGMFMCLSKMVFSKVLKNFFVVFFFFLQSYSLFLYFSVNLKSNYAKPKGGRNIIVFEK